MVLRHFVIFGCTSTLVRPGVQPATFHLAGVEPVTVLKVLPFAAVQQTRSQKLFFLSTKLFAGTADHSESVVTMVERMFVWRDMTSAWGEDARSVIVEALVQSEDGMT